GDLGVGDLLPTPPDDERLVPGYLHSDDPAVEEVAWELGLGRARVMSRQGRIDTARRWYEGDRGPNAPISTAAPPSARCGSGGFWLPLAGWPGQLSGVCGHLYAPDDGKAASADHGGGAHSAVLVERDEPAAAARPTTARWSVPTTGAGPTPRWWWSATSRRSPSCRPCTRTARWSRSPRADVTGALPPPGGPPAVVDDHDSEPGDADEEPRHARPDPGRRPVDHGQGQAHHRPDRETGDGERHHRRIQGRRAAAGRPRHGRGAAVGDRCRAVVGHPPSVRKRSRFRPAPP